MFWDFLMFYQIFLSTQAKRWAIITYKHGIYELCHELPNDLRLSLKYSVIDCSYLRENIVNSGHNSAHTVNSFVAPLDITDILQMNY